MGKGLNKVFRDVSKFVSKNKVVLALFVGVFLYGCKCNCNRLLEGLTSQPLNISGMEEGKKTLLYLYWEKCGHCTKFTPTWNEFSSENQSNIVPIKLEGTNNDEGRRAADTLGVNSYPTIVLLDENGKKIEDYTGQREKRALLDYCNSK